MGRGLQLLVEWVHEAIAAGDFDELETCLLVVREAATRFRREAQRTATKPPGAAKDMSDEDLKELLDRFVWLCRLEDAISALAGEVEQRLIDSGRLNRSH